MTETVPGVQVTGGELGIGLGLISLVEDFLEDGACSPQPISKKTTVKSDSTMLNVRIIREAPLLDAYLKTKRLFGESPATGAKELNSPSLPTTFK